MCQSTHSSQLFPHGELEQVFPNIWFVQGGWDMPVPLKPRISRSMVIIRHSQDSITLVNSMRLNDEGLKQLEALGRVENVIRLASMHGADDNFYRERYGAKVYALKGTQYTRGLTVDIENTKSYLQPDFWFDEKTRLPIPEAKVWVMRSPKLKEACLLLPQHNGILLSGDMLHNTPRPNSFTNITAKLFMRLFGLARSYNIGVGWWHMTKPSGDELRQLLTLPFEHVLPIHGEPVIGNAKNKYRKAIERFASRSDAKQWHSNTDSNTGHPEREMRG
ncbi:hypothetical protein [Aliikangiella sp. G2MR2-5]|uniref:hypothetical protein n=1 Tax=Aliikangiella sp. G2MR2-5 TaxID=2788943 RepID=UPI0018AC184B|nr:hypothetical protein [Aliikangiella sp. G2MR2-5]